MGRGNKITNKSERRVPYRISPRRATPKHILIIAPKIKHKEKILKATKEKQKVTYKGCVCVCANVH